MQLSLPIDGEMDLLREIDRRLRLRFGPPGPWDYLDPVSQLVLGMIGGRTFGAVSLRAFETLKGRFGTLERVRDAPPHEIYNLIRPVTFADVKAERLKTALQVITAARGILDLDFLRHWDVDLALKWLERLPGVGRKTSAATLNLSTLCIRVLVIDTHHRRVLERLELATSGEAPASVFERIMSFLPPEWTARHLDDHHHRVKRLGQEICRHGHAACSRCPLRDLCPSARRS